ncbi:MAG: hypothetical protein KGK35_04095, partial [Xanthomonadaceae bacterium]|nr:hypothetical protein [Xanthomonadaceae bacterium]
PPTCTAVIEAGTSNAGSGMRVAVTTIVGSEWSMVAEAGATDCAKATEDQHATGANNILRTARGNARLRGLAEGQNLRHAPRGENRLSNLVERDTAISLFNHGTLAAETRQTTRAVRRAR